MEIQRAVLLQNCCSTPKRGELLPSLVNNILIQASPPGWKDNNSNRPFYAHLAYWFVEALCLCFFYGSYSHCSMHIPSSGKKNSSFCLQQSRSSGPPPPSEDEGRLPWHMNNHHWQPHLHKSTSPFQTQATSWPSPLNSFSVWERPSIVAHSTCSQLRFIKR